MKKFVKLTLVIVVCLCLISTNLLANACLLQSTYKQNDENFDISNDMINSRIRNLERINNRLSKFNEKPSAKKVEEAVVSVNPNSIVLDMNEIKGIETSDDLLKTFEERNVKLPDNLDKNSLVKATQELKVISITDDKNVYFILEYNHETGQILRNPTKWCDDCFMLVALDMVENGMHGFTYIGWWGAVGGAILALLYNIDLAGYCPNCEAKILEMQETVFIEAVPLCSGCQNHYSWINQAYYCETCEVWN